ncbi:unnamed protein product [Vitrella brassicaformis CCMP3155]|uniref:Uncharacterized protein n=1 Tax=Vitrella brassicaformis (strain CCMP3155) TaxID=1169540 RepID=A0A0G4G4S8_VITBC|nr:unnamed protein product [Vitrella brassicaformis CCMP3155]|eukprot:CEM23313.1 unnamed protein product [Vitrella brassicaformis CCMP3155]
MGSCYSTLSGYIRRWWRNRCVRRSTLVALRIRVFYGVCNVYGTVPEWVFSIPDLPYVQLCAVAKHLGENGELADDDAKGAFRAAVVRMSCQVRFMRVYWARTIRGEPFGQEMEKTLPKPPHYPDILNRPLSEAISICRENGPGRGQVEDAPGGLGLREYK